MKKTTEFILIIMLFFVLFPSCRREDIAIRSCEYDLYVSENGETCLKIYLMADIPDLNRTKMRVSDPSGELVWNVKPESLKVKGISYIGYDGISMPKGLVIPYGKWNVELIYADGRTISETFSVKSDGSADQFK